MPELPRATAIVPSQVNAAEATLVLVRGEDFLVEAVNNVDTGKTDINTNFQIRLVPQEDGAASVSLQEVAYIDSQTLQGIVPAGTRVGTYLARVTGPAGEGPLGTATITVFSDLDNDAIHDDVDPCVDVDGDGLGREPYDTSGCAHADNDSDDEVATVCADTDGDGCEDCSTGTWAPTNDGDDVDSDGICATNDCDDNNVNCDTDCTDADNDLFCRNHDCDDDSLTGAACTSGCSTFFADADGDGFGDASSTILACSVPAGFVVDNTDCADDASADAACAGLPGNLCHPGLAGSDDCDGVDNDCDTASDEDYLETATSCGVGACAGHTGTLSCVVGVETDSCDAFAGATPENLATAGSCTDTLDNDCDGESDGADLNCQSGNNTPPIAGFFVSPPAGDAGTNFAGDATASFDLEDPLPALDIAWDWDGDGIFEQSGSISNHVFASPGAQTVTLRVTDSGGLPDFHSFIVSVADPANLIVVTTGVDESDGGATPASPGGTGLSLREAAAFASAQSTRQTIFVPNAITSVIGSLVPLNSGSAGFDVVGDQALIDGQTLDVCVTIAGTATVRFLGFEVANCNGDGINIGTGAHVISRNEVHDSDIGIKVTSPDTSVVGPHNTIFSCGRGVLATAPIELIDNIIRDNAGEGVKVRLNANGSVIRGNEIVRNATGVEISQVDSVSVLHNTIYDHAAFAIDIVNSASNVTLLNNILHTAGTAAIASTDTEIALLDTNCYVAATQCTACTPGPGSTSSDPLFIDESLDDFRLQPTSTLIDKATDTGLDVNGAAPGNFAGLAPDIGAHETP